MCGRAKLVARENRRGKKGKKKPEKSHRRVAESEKERERCKQWKAAGDGKEICLRGAASAKNASKRIRALLFQRVRTRAENGG